MWCFFFKAILASQYYCLLPEESLGGVPYELTRQRQCLCIFVSMLQKKRVLKAWIVLVTKLVAYKVVILL